MSLEELEKDFTAERAQADKWYSQLKNREIGWIKQGLNADAEFDKLYKEEPQLDASQIEFNWFLSVLLIEAIVAANFGSSAKS